MNKHYTLTLMDTLFNRQPQYKGKDNCKIPTTLQINLCKKDASYIVLVLKCPYLATKNHFN